MRINLAFAGALFLSVTQTSLAADVQLTIYNQGFAVVRDSVPLDLKAGRNEIQFNGVTSHLEPDSVILRDPAGKNLLRVIEQNYRSDSISADLLLSLYEGRTIEFQVGEHIVEGKVIRSGYTPHTTAFQQYGSQYAMSQQNMAQGTQPLIEIEGKLRFGLPGTPIFPALTQDSILKPTLKWILDADHAANLLAELSYVTSGMNWRADYNIVSPENGDTVDLIGWVTMDNQSGRQFDQAHIQLMAGDVNKSQARGGGGEVYARTDGISLGMPGAPVVTERRFDEFHLYTLQNATTLRDRETKQMEFVRAAGISSRRVYVYDGMMVSPQFAGWNPDQLRQNPSFGTQSNTKVWVMREFDNTQANHLGIPLPKGRVRFYTQDTDRRLQFVGENSIDHTPQGEKVSVYAGNAFDLVGARRQANFDIRIDRHHADETFEITVRNRKAVPASVLVVEHLYRGDAWTIADNSEPWSKADSSTIHFNVNLKPDEERTVKYRVHYTW